MRAKQVGMLMRAYRLGYSSQGRSGRLSQSGLIDLMAAQDADYCDKYDHSTVSRWERGGTLPEVKHLRVFGRALNLSDVEVDGLMLLAGEGESRASAPEAMQAEAQTNERAVDALYEMSFMPAASASGAEMPVPSPATSYAPSPATIRGNEFADYGRRDALRFAASRFLLPAACIAVAGYILASYGWNAPWLLAAYIVLAIGLVTFRSIKRMRRSHDMQELLFLTVFFLLSCPLAHAPITYAGPYGLYAIEAFAGTTIPFTLSLALHLFVACIAALGYGFLSKWQSSKSADAPDSVDGSAVGSVIKRAAWRVVPPLALPFAVLLVFSNIGGWMAGLCVFTVSAGVLIAMLTLREGAVRVSEWDRRFMLYVVVTLTVMLSVLGVIAALIIFLEPSLLAASGHAMFYSWEIDFESLGYPAGEFMERYRHAILLGALVSLAYMVSLGLNLIATIYRLDCGDPDMAAAPAGVAAAVARERRERSAWLEARYRLRALCGLRVPRPLRGWALAFVDRRNPRRALFRHADDVV